MAPRSEAAKAIEAILMVAQEPVDPHLLAQLLEIGQPIVEELCQQLADSYEAEERGFVLAKVAGGYRFQSHADLAPYVERFVLEGQTARLSAAALETLAIVAYKQPLSRAQVASIRGVNVDGVMRTLVQRGYLVEVGRDPGPGQATLFGTSREFLERLGLDDLDDLPPINELFPDSSVMEALERGLRAEPAPAVEPRSEPGDRPGPEPVARPPGEPGHGAPTDSESDARDAAGEPTEPPTGTTGADPGIPTIPLDAPVDDLLPPSWALDPDPSPASDADADDPGIDPTAPTADGRTGPAEGGPDVPPDATPSP